jgi:hypothetical protein
MSRNGYAYAEGNPVNYTDPSGTCIDPLSFVVCAAVGGLIIGGVTGAAYNVFATQGYGVGGHNQGQPIGSVDGWQTALYGGIGAGIGTSVGGMAGGGTALAGLTLGGVGVGVANGAISGAAYTGAHWTLSAAGLGSGDDFQWALRHNPLALMTEVAIVAACLAG